MRNDGLDIEHKNSKHVPVRTSIVAPLLTQGSSETSRFIIVIEQNATVTLTHCVCNKFVCCTRTTAQTRGVISDRSICIGTGDIGRTNRVAKFRLQMAESSCCSRACVTRATQAIVSGYHGSICICTGDRGRTNVGTVAILS